MQKVGGRITLSPSDLNDYLECPHLTTLALQVARGERARPFVADDHAELLRRKGEQHERAYLERLRADGRGFMVQAPWMVVFPGLAVMLAVLGFNMLADGLRDWLDPQHKAA